MANRLASILEQEYKTKGLVGGTASAVGKAAKEKLDIRNALFSGEGIGSVIGTKIFGKGYSATKREKTRTQKSTSPESLSSSLSSGESPVLQEMNANMKLTAKNSMSLPMMARDMNLMKLNIFKLVKSFGDKANTNKTDMFYEKSKIRDAAYNNTIGKMMGKGRLGTLSKSVFIGKKERDGQTPETALYITGGSGGDTDETSLIGGILTSMGKSATLAKLATMASAVVTSPLFLASAGVLSIVALAKKLRDDEISSDPEKYKDVASVRAKREGVTNKTAGARNAAEARTGSLTQGDADGIIETLIKEKMFGISAENFIREYYPKNPEITLQTILNICDPKLKEEYQKMLAANMPPAPPAPTPTVLPVSPAGAGRGLVNPENVSPTPQQVSSVPSNAVTSSSGSPIGTGTPGVYVTSGSSSPTPSSMSSTATSGGTAPKPVTSNPSEGENAVRAAAAKYGITDQTEINALLAQTSHESGNYRYLTELGGKSYFDKYEPGTSIGRELGNTQPGDGYKYRGRGYIQLTGRDNYQKFAQFSGIDVVNNPDLVASPALGAEAALFYWRTRVKPKVKDFSNVQQVTQLVNGGQNGIRDREQKFAALMTASSGQSSPSVTSPPKSTGSAIASASTSVSDQKMAAMIPTGGQTTVVNGAPITVGSSKSSSRVSPFQKEFHDKIISAIALT